MAGLSPHLEGRKRYIFFLKIIHKHLEIIYVFISIVFFIMENSETNFDSGENEEKGCEIILDLFSSLKQGKC